ncbi:hypothetical protein CC79DRAFT_863428 [Sarocladium strictum]
MLQCQQHLPEEGNHFDSASGHNPHAYGVPGICIALCRNCTRRTRHHQSHRKNSRRVQHDCPSCKGGFTVGSPRTSVMGETIPQTLRDGTIVFSLLDVS